MSTEESQTTTVDVADVGSIPIPIAVSNHDAGTLSGPPDVIIPAGPPPPALPFPARSGDAEILLPKFAYIIDRQNRYLTFFTPEPNNTLTFKPGPPDIEAIVEVFRKGPSSFQFAVGRHNLLITTLEGRGERWYGCVWGIDVPVRTFEVIGARGDTVFLRDDLSPSHFMSSRLTSVGSPLARTMIDQDSEMRIRMAAVRREIFDVRYRIDEAQVRSAPPRIALSTAVRNDSSSSDVSQELGYSYERWSAGTWNNSVGVEVGASISFRAGVPFVFSVRMEVGISAEFTHEWGREEGTREIVESATTVVVPPRKRAHVLVIVRNAQIDVGFTYTERILWSNGQTETREVATGIYRNVDSFHVDVEVTDWEDI